MDDLPQTEPETILRTKVEQCANQTYSVEYNSQKGELSAAPSCDEGRKRMICTSKSNHRATVCISIYLKIPPYIISKILLEQLEYKDCYTACCK